MFKIQKIKDSQFQECKTSRLKILNQLTDPGEGRGRGTEVKEHCSAETKLISCHMQAYAGIS